MPNTPSENEPDEIDVTELLEKIGNVEKENSAQKEKITQLESAVAKLTASVDRLAELFGKRG